MNMKKKNDLVAQASRLLGGAKQAIGFENVREELEALTAGIEQMNFADALSVWMYATLRTDFTKNKSELTAEESAWRSISQRLEEDLKSCDTDNGEPINFNSLRNSIEDLRDIVDQVTLRDLPEMVSDLEEKFVNFEAYAICHLDKGNSDYCKCFEVLGDHIKKSDKPSERIENAKQMQKLNEAYSEAFFKPVRRLQDDIGNDLFLMQKAIPIIEDEVLRTLFEKWCELSRRVYLNLVMASNCIRIDYEFNCEFAKSVIDANGKTDRGNPKLKSLVENYGLMLVVASEKHKETQKLNKERKHIFERMFPKQKEHEKEPVQHSKIQLDFDARRFLKTLLSMYVVSAIFGVMILSNEGESAVFGLALPIILLFEGGFIPAIVIGFIVYCCWTVWDQKHKP
ncbi:MAG: hypothetical protein ABIG34_03265 [Candidatus Peregrinibacteria bacterium]